ncbi:MAG: peptidoglycan DD-metalloendopeptidase family protein [Sphingomonadaceae bacterium]
MGITLALLSACSTTPHLAPVVDRNPSAPASKPAPAGEPAPAARDERGMYTVKKGDTLIRIALEFGQNYRDLVAWNNLSNPNDIKVDQVLRVQPPEAGSSAVQVGAIVMPPSETKPPVSVIAPVIRKIAPKGDKRPYSDSTLAELQRPDNGKAEQVAAIAPALTPPPVTPPPPPIPPLPDDDKLSWIWPSDGKVVASFDEGKNKGVDIAGKAGQPVVAAGAGKVMYAGSGIRGYGNLVIVKHNNSLLSAYAHNRTIVVKEGQTVNKGEKIAEMGDSDTDAVKLHFEIRQQGKPVDPSKFLPNR